MLAIRRKSVWEVKLFSASWGNFLETGETILTSTWLIETGDSALVLGDDATPAKPSSVDGSTVYVWALEGTFGAVYKIVNRITTSLERKEDDAFLLEIREPGA